MKPVTEQISRLEGPISLTKTMLKKSLEEIEVDYWGDPTFPSGLAIACHELRTVPLDQLTNGQLRMAIGQEMSLPYLVPMAVKALSGDPLLEGTFFEGDLLENVLKVDDDYFRWDKSAASSMSDISERAANSLSEKIRDSKDDELLLLAYNFIGKNKVNFPEKTFDMTKPIYLFDGHCVLCSRAVHYVLQHEKSPDMRFVAILSRAGREFAETNGINPDEPESFLILKDNKVYYSSDAIIVLAQYIGGVHKLAVLGKILPRPLRDWLYGRIARNRYKIFGKTEQCYVPSPDNRHRFVLT